MALAATWSKQHPVARSTAPKMLRRRLVPGVITGWRAPRATGAGGFRLLPAPPRPRAVRWAVGAGWPGLPPRPGSPLATSRGRHHPTTSRTLRRKVARLMAGGGQAAGRAEGSSTPWLSHQPQDALGGPWAAQAWTARPRLVTQSGDAVLVVAVDPAADRAGITAQHPGDGVCGLAAGRQQDHDQAHAHTVRPIQRTEDAAGAAGRAGEVGVHAAGTHPWRRPRRLGGAVEGFSDPRGYFIAAITGYGHNLCPSA
jgi:hypothetical protein